MLGLLVTTIFENNSHVLLARDWVASLTTRCLTRADPSPLKISSHPLSQCRSLCPFNPITSLWTHKQSMPTSGPLQLSDKWPMFCLPGDYSNLTIVASRAPFLTINKTGQVAFGISPLIITVLDNLLQTSLYLRGSNHSTVSTITGFSLSKNHMWDLRKLSELYTLTDISLKFALLLWVQVFIATFRVVATLVCIRKNNEESLWNLRD